MERLPWTVFKPLSATARDAASLRRANRRVSLPTLDNTVALEESS